MMFDKYSRVSSEHPCPICGKPDWCLIARDGSHAICPRVESNVLWSPGFMHELYGGTAISNYFDDYDGGREYLSDESLMALFMQGLENTTTDWLDFHGRQLGVSVDTLMAVGAVNLQSDFVAFPMFVPCEDCFKISGFRLRHADGRKVSITGSRDGVFMSHDVPNRLDTIYVVEGASDTAVGVDMGIFTVGRPNCTGGTDILIELFDRPQYSDNRCVIIADRDSVGQRGATRLYNELKRNGVNVDCILTPKIHDDLRDYRRWFVGPKTAKRFLENRDRQYWSVSEECVTCHS